MVGQNGRLCTGDLPEAHCALFEFLIRHASNAEDPLNVRQKQLRGVAQLKELVYSAARVYDGERAKLGLPLEILLVESTALDRAVEAAYIENHD